MSYLDVTVEMGDNYTNRFCFVRLPHDTDVKDADKLKALSGKVTRYNLKGEGHDHPVIGK